MLKSVGVLATVISCYFNTTNNIFLAVLQQTCTVLMDLCMGGLHIESCKCIFVFYRVMALEDVKKVMLPN